jgi:hypothetical protein
VAVRGCGPGVWLVGSVPLHAGAVVAAPLPQLVGGGPPPGPAHPAGRAGPTPFEIVHLSPLDEDEAGASPTGDVVTRDAAVVLDGGHRHDCFTRSALLTPMSASCDDTGPWTSSIR